MKLLFLHTIADLTHVDLALNLTSLDLTSELTTRPVCVLTIGYRIHLLLYLEVELNIDSLLVTIIHLHTFYNLCVCSVCVCISVRLSLHQNYLHHALLSC